MAQPPSISRRLAAWGVHLFTATGIVCAFFAVLAVNQNEIPLAFGWLLLALFIDGVDGTFARLLKVKEVLPHVQGKWIDYVVDFANYAFVPAYILYMAKVEVAGQQVFLLPDGCRELAVAVVLLVSALYYGLEGMVDEGLHFIGFPVLWNVVAFYLFFVFQASPWVNFGLVMVFAVLHFVPIKYPYPSRTRRFMALNIGMTAMGFVANGKIVWDRVGDEQPHWLWLALSGAAAVYYLVAAVLYTFNKKA